MMRLLLAAARLGCMVPELVGSSRQGAGRCGVQQHACQGCCASKHEPRVQRAPMAACSKAHAIVHSRTHEEQRGQSGSKQVCCTGRLPHVASKRQSSVTM